MWEPATETEKQEGVKSLFIKIRLFPVTHTHAHAHVTTSNTQQPGVAVLIFIFHHCSLISDEHRS